MRVFVTGGSGFLGYEIVAELLARGHECATLARGDIGVTRLAHLGKRITFVRADLFAPESYRIALARFQPRALIHCAWHGAAGVSADDLRQLDNVRATESLVNAAIDAGARIILGVGSQAEYGPKSGAITETASADPTTLYGVAKLAACGATSNLASAHGARDAWARVFALYGPGDDDGRRLISMVLRALREGRAPELTRCEQMWDFLHVRDAARAIVALLECPTARGVFNIGSGAPARLRDVVLTLRDLVAPRIEPAFGAVPYRPDQVMHLEADISRIRRETGWCPQIPLSSGLAELAARPGAGRAAA
jgi:nucleoside-diphosphate-sugar epimerase